MAENVYHQHEYHSWYALKYFEGDTEEWPVEVNSDLKITGVKSEGQDTLCIYGPTYLNSEFSQLLFEKIKDIYEDESKKDYYWENVFVDSIEEFELFGNVLHSDVVEEFECFEELVEFDTSYVENPRNEIIETICKVMNVKPNEIKSIESLKNGKSHDSFCFVVNDEKYVCRMPVEGTELPIKRLN